MDAAFLEFKVEENHMVCGQKDGPDSDIITALSISEIKSYRSFFYGWIQ